MAKSVRWTIEAEETFANVIGYLEREWTEKEIANFIMATNDIIENIKSHPAMFRRSKKKDTHEALVTEHNLMIYKIYRSHIDILLFWDTRQNPRRKKF